MSTAIALVPQQPLATMDVGEVRVLAENVAKSRLFKGFESVEAAFTLMMVCQAEGIHPMLAMRRYDVIQGRPALKSDAMLADFMKGGGKVTWTQHDHTVVEGVFEAPGLGAPLTVRWTMEDAKKAGLANKDNWKGYSRQMLRARVVSEGVRMAMPGVVAGIYTPEETQDFEPRENPAPTYQPPAAHPLLKEATHGPKAPASTSTATTQPTGTAAGSAGPKAPSAVPATGTTNGTGDTRKTTISPSTPAQTGTTGSAADLGREAVAVQARGEADEAERVAAMGGPESAQAAEAEVSNRATSYQIEKQFRKRIGWLGWTREHEVEFLLAFADVRDPEKLSSDEIKQAIAELDAEVEKLMPAQPCTKAKRNQYFAHCRRMWPGPGTTFDEVAAKAWLMKHHKIDTVKFCSVGEMDRIIESLEQAGPNEEAR